MVKAEHQPIPESSRHTEIEKTFLVTVLPDDILESPSTIIRQGYLSQPDDPQELRLRQSGDKFELTTKTPVEEGNYSKFTEETTDLVEEDFNAMWKKVDRSLEKVRYMYPINDDLVAEVDVFQGELKGLIIVEVEVQDEEALNFTPPSWFGRDITPERWVAGKNLAGKKIEDIHEHLA